MPHEIRPSQVYLSAAAVLLPSSAFANGVMLQAATVLTYFAAPIVLLAIACLVALVIFIRIRWREIGNPRLQKTMLHESDFRSIWDIAHIWAGQPSTENQTEPSEQVVDKVQKLIWAFTRKKILLRTRSGYRVPNDDFYFLFYNLNRPRIQLVEMLARQRFDAAILDTLYVMRSDVLKWCEDEFLSPPPIWAVRINKGDGGKEQKAIVGKHRNEALDKQLCQAVARTLWDFDPRIHPAHMVQHKAIQKYANAGMYEDDETIRNWIVEVDPLRKERKTGRPPAIRPLIDMENGGFRKDCVMEFTDKGESP